MFLVSLLKRNSTSAHFTISQEPITMSHSLICSSVPKLMTMEDYLKRGLLMVQDRDMLKDLKKVKKF